MNGKPKQKIEVARVFKENLKKNTADYDLKKKGFLSRHKKLTNGRAGDVEWFSLGQNRVGGLDGRGGGGQEYHQIQCAGVQPLTTSAFNLQIKQILR